MLVDGQCNPQAYRVKYHRCLFCQEGIAIAARIQAVDKTSIRFTLANRCQHRVVSRVFVKVDCNLVAFCEFAQPCIVRIPAQYRHRFAIQIRNRGDHPGTTGIDLAPIDKKVFPVEVETLQACCAGGNRGEKIDLLRSQQLLALQPFAGHILQAPALPFGYILKQIRNESMDRPLLVIIDQRGILIDTHSQWFLPAGHDLAAHKEQQHEYPTQSPCQQLTSGE